MDQVKVLNSLPLQMMMLEKNQILVQLSMTIQLQMILVLMRVLDQMKVQVQIGQKLKTDFRKVRNEVAEVMVVDLVTVVRRRVNQREVDKYNYSER